MINYHDLSKKSLTVEGKELTYYKISEVTNKLGIDIKTLPYSIRIILESLIRQEDGVDITAENIETLAKWSTDRKSGDVPFKPARVILQDFTGVPAVVDLASVRQAVVDFGGNAEQINPEIPVDLVIDHSVQVDVAGTMTALEQNVALEFERNNERYEFLKWAQSAFENYRVVPPATGIIHQVNIEYLSEVVIEKEIDNSTEVFPDTLFGTDSHTTMINGIGVLGWGVGGIEAEACMLGEPSYFPIPDVVGVRLVGQLQLGATATDLALKVTQVLREEKVVGKFVEYFGKGMQSLSLADRATVANMAPEYGATCGFFPVDDETLNYMTLTGRKVETIKRTEAVCKNNHLFYDPANEPVYTKIVEINLDEIESNLSGPKRPQDLIPLSKVKENFEASLTAPEGNKGFGLSDDEINKSYEFELNGHPETLRTGDVAIASITSCTNTSNPSVMIAAGLLARNAVAKGLTVSPKVKTSLAPGSKVVTAYLENSGLITYLDDLGFEVVGYGCATCIGNSGPLQSEISKAIQESDMLVSAVLSGNRNFEGRIHAQVKANYLASPPLVVAYALAGNIDKDLMNEAIGISKSGDKVYLKDIWPNDEEINDYAEKYVTTDLFNKSYSDVFSANAVWNAIETGHDVLYEWNPKSTYIANPPFFEGMTKEIPGIKPLKGLKVLAKFGDSVTTDHISPAGAIGINSPAGKYLQEKGVAPKDFNSFGSRRGNHEVMMRGTFGNIRIRNQIAKGTEGGVTIYWPTEEIMPMYDAAMLYKEEAIPLVVLAGSDYGMGSSRDWAAKGTRLLGVQVVIAKSYERIHRSNLVMMGVLPLQFKEGEDATTLGLNGDETFSFDLPKTPDIHQLIQVTATSPNSNISQFETIARFDAEADIRYYKNQGILPMVIRKKMSELSSK